MSVESVNKMELKNLKNKDNCVLFLYYYSTFPSSFQTLSVNLDNLNISMMKANNMLKVLVKQLL